MSVKPQSSFSRWILKLLERRPPARHVPSSTSDQFAPDLRPALRAWNRFGTDNCAGLFVA
jgi:hypothetical protein